MTHYIMTHNEANAYFNPQRSTIEETYYVLRYRVYTHLLNNESTYLFDAFMRDLDGDEVLSDRLMTCRNWAGRIVTDIAQVDRMIAKVWDADDKVRKTYRENPAGLDWAMWDRGKVVHKARNAGLTVETSAVTHNVLRVY